MLYLGIDQHAKQLTLSLRSKAGDMIFNRQVSIRPERIHEFFSELQQEAADDGYVAIVDVCGFNVGTYRVVSGRLKRSVPN